MARAAFAALLLAGCGGDDDPRPATDRNAQGRPVADATDDLRAMVERGLELGVDTYLVDVLPWNNGHPDADGAIEHLNAAIRELGNEQGVEVVGFHDALEDPDEPGVMRPALTDDGDHPSVEGYRRLGTIVAEAVLDGTPTGGVEQDG